MTFLYSDYVTTVTNLLDLSAILVNPTSATPTSDTNFNNALPRSIEYTELRIQRDLDLQATSLPNESGTLNPNTRLFTLPTNLGAFIVVEQAYLIVNGVRQPPMTPCSIEALNAIYPSDTALSPAPSLPAFWAPNDSATIFVGPAPDAAYGIGIYGTVRLPPLSATNIQNNLTQFFPDLYVACSMVWWYGYQRDYGAQSDDPHAAMSWETQYMTLLKSAGVEESRKKFESAGWSARQPSVLATPPQT